MKRIAILDEQNVVINIALGNSSDFPNAVDLSTYTGLPPSQGWTWDGSQFHPPTKQPRTVLSKSEFIDRFTFDELVAIRTMVAQGYGSNPTADGIKMAVLWDQVSNRQHINVESELAQTAKALLTAMGVITQDRADEIFAPAD